MANSGANCETNNEAINEASYFLGNRPLISDQEYYDRLVKIVIYSGLYSRINNRFDDSIQNYFSDFREVATYSEEKALELFRDDAMLHNLSKIKACIFNAKTFVSLCEIYGSMEMYFSGYDTLSPDEKYARMSDDLSGLFKYLGEKNVVKYINAVHCQQS